MNQTFVKSTRFKQVCQLLLSLIVAQAIIKKMNNFKYYSESNKNQFEKSQRFVAQLTGFYASKRRGCFLAITSVKS